MHWTRVLATLVLCGLSTVSRSEPPPTETTQGDPLIAKYVELETAKREKPLVPATREAWQKQRDGWRTQLKQHCFGAWPEESLPLDAKVVFEAEQGSMALRAIDFTSQGPFRLRLYIAHYPGLEDPDLIVLNPLTEEGWVDFLATMRPGFEAELKGLTLPPADEKAFKQTQGMFRSFKWAMAYFAPCGIGPTAWDPSEARQKERQQQFQLLGQTVDSMRVWDVRRAIQTLRSKGGMKTVPLWLQAGGHMSGVTLYASLWEPKITRLDLYDLAGSHRDGPFFLNIHRFLDTPQAVAMASERTQVLIYQEENRHWDYPLAVAKKLDWEQNLRLLKPPSEDP